MITNFSIFEANADKPKVGNYVILIIQKKIIPNIGKIDHINYNSGFPYMIKFGDDFNYYEYGLSDKYMVVDIDEIAFWSKNKEDLELKLISDKYNL